MELHKQINQLLLYPYTVSLSIRNGSLLFLNEKTDFLTRTIDLTRLWKPTWSNYNLVCTHTMNVPSPIAGLLNIRSAYEICTYIHTNMIRPGRDRKWYITCGHTKTDTIRLHHPMRRLTHIIILEANAPQGTSVYLSTLV